MEILHIDFGVFIRPCRFTAGGLTISFIDPNMISILEKEIDLFEYRYRGFTNELGGAIDVGIVFNIFKDKPFTISTVQAMEQFIFDELDRIHPEGFMNKAVSLSYKYFDTNIYKLKIQKS